MPDAQNARQHSDRNRRIIAESIGTVGAARSIVIDENSRVLAGNATRDAALELGLKLQIVDTDGQTLIAVRRTGLSEEQKTALAIADNRAAELAAWNPATLADLKRQGVSLDQFFSANELRVILEPLDEERAGLTRADEIPALRRTSIRPGDLFVLGDHRILCGDSTSVAAVATLMGDERASLFATDPPYLVGYTGTVKLRDVQSRDDADTTDWDNAEQGQAFFDAFISAAKIAAIQPRAAWYCWHACWRQAMLEAAWKKAGAFVHQQIIWIKSRAAFGRSVYMWRHEPCFFGWQRTLKPQVRKAPLVDGHPTTVWRPRDGMVGVPADLPTTVWMIPSTEVETVEHPTSKPVRVFTIPLLMHTNRGAVCYEPFAGSGSQIIGAEQTGRRCFAMEAEPKYVQLTIDRWEAFTGRKAAKDGLVERSSRQG